MRVFRNPFAFHRRCASAVIVGALLTACGGGGGGGGGAATQPPATPTGLAISYDVKAVSFTWDAMPGATFYRVFEDSDGPGPLPATQVGGDQTTVGFQVIHTVLLHERINAQYTVSACNTFGCSQPTAALQPDLVKAIGYVKASNTRTKHLFGIAVALSADGTTLAVGAGGEDSGSSGVNGGEATNPPLPSSGAVYVYVRSTAGIWSKQAYLKASNPDQSDGFGRRVALSADGNTLAVSSLREDSKGMNVGDDTQEDNTQTDSGAVYVFGRTAEGVWSQQAYVKASNTGAGDLFGAAVGLSGDGHTLAVGAPSEDGPTDTLADSGAVYVYVRADGAWSWQAYLRAQNAQVEGRFGIAVALSKNGDTLAIGSSGESSVATRSGAVYVFSRDSENWSQTHRIKASNAGTTNYFGETVALSSEGDTLAVGAPFEASDGNDKSNDDLTAAGAVYVYVRQGAGWTEQAFVKPSNPGALDYFGSSISLSADGSKLAVGAAGEQSASKGINGVQSDETASKAGAVYLFVRDGSAWLQQAYIKASNTRGWQDFGTAVGLSGNGRTLAVGAPTEDSRSTGIHGDQGNDGGFSFDAGAVYLY